MPPKPPINPTLDLKYYAPLPPKKDMSGPNMASYAPLYPQSFPPGYMGPGLAPLVPPTIINNYAFDKGLFPRTTMLRYIKQDSLPDKNLNKTFDTLAERLIIYKFIRGTIFANSDGTDINLDGQNRSLLSYVKLDDVNPYRKNKFLNNSYMGMAEDFILIRSSYPIQKEVTKEITCVKDAMSINIRIYKMTEGSYLTGMTKSNTFIYYDEWRELAFYEYIRENIIKTKMCPNFPTIFGYFISTDSKIPFDKINKLSGNNTPTPQKTFIVHKDMNGNPIKINPNSSLSSLMKLYVPDNKTKFGADVKTISYTGANGRVIVSDPTQYKGKALVILTESSTCSLYDWASVQYKKEGVIMQMINRGSHTDDEWLNILFQIMAALYTCEISQIYIDNFSLEHNVLIKDIGLKGSVSSYWKYIIDDISYYVPNNGSIVMIDSNFNDIANDKQTTSFANIVQNASNASKLANPHKIGGKFLDSDMLDDKGYSNKAFEMFKICVDPNNYKNSYCTEPSSTIMTMLEDITKDITNDTDSKKTIGKYIKKFMTKFMNNRIGTYLKEIEIPHIRKENKNFTNGQLAIYEAAHNEYICVLFCELNANGNAVVLTRDSNEIIQNIYPLSSIHNYSKSEILNQNFKGLEKFSEEDLLEIYTIKK